MEIEFNPSRAASSPVNQPTAKTQSKLLSQPMSLGNAEALKTAVNNLPPSRSEQVGRARSLVSDPAYPPAEMLNAVAGLLAKNLE